MDFKSLQEINEDSLILRRITENHRHFISDMFLDPENRKYYIVPKEA